MSRRSDSTTITESFEQALLQRYTDIGISSKANFAILFLSFEILELLPKASGKTRVCIPLLWVFSVVIMSSGSGGSSKSPSSSDTSNPEPHEPLGPCPHGHDNYSRDCQCPCAECPNAHIRTRESRRIPFPRRGRLRREEILRQIRQEITRWIREGGRFHREPARVVHGAVPALRHDETVGLPPGPVVLRELRSRDPGRARLPPEVMLLVSRHMGGFDEGESSEHFPADPLSHNNFTLALAQRPCTEQTPWNEPVRNWFRPCPNDRRGLGGYRGQSWPCNETNCPHQERGDKMQRYDHNREAIESDDEDFEDDYDEVNDDDPPGDPRTPNGDRWVCEDHKRDTAQYWQQENLIKAHLVPTCNKCKDVYQAQYPTGHNSCTCLNLLDRWQCRRCYEKKVRKLQTHFRQRVVAHYTGEADVGMVASNRGIMNNQDRPDLGPGLGTYHWTTRRTEGWRRIRRMLVENHPCINPGLSSQCGRRRAWNQMLAMHCRSCGGVVIQASRARPPAVLTRENRVVTRSSRRQQGASPLWELVFPRGTRGAPANRSGTVRLLPTT